MEQIPQSVLADYQNRTVIGVLQPQWANAEHTMLDVLILVKELLPLGYVPFSTVADADTRHGQEVWDKALAGEYGPIAEYKEEQNDD